MERFEPSKAANQGKDPRFFFSARETSASINVNSDTA
jgi:hypothetical protein